jgi:predicted DNA-binding transcriptional regulator YafY
MPVNKSALIRYMTLDRCLQRRFRPYGLDELQFEVNKQLEEAGYAQSDSISIRTIYADLRFMESDSGFGAPIKRILNHGRKVYYYEDPEFSAMGASFSLQQELLELMCQFSGLPQFDWIHEYIGRLKLTLPSKIPIFRFNQNPFVAGIGWLKPLYYAIREQSVIKLNVKCEADAEGAVILFHPWQLREYASRWFLLGRSSRLQRIDVVALENINSVEAISEIKFLLPETEDWEDHFEDTIGPFPITGNQIQTIRLLVDGKTDAKLKKVPIHHSQKRITHNNGYTEYRLKVVVNEELEYALLSMGPGIHVIEPHHLQRKMNELVHKMATCYNKLI